MHTISFHTFFVWYTHETLVPFEVISSGCNISTIGRLRNCLDAHLGQIVCDKDGVVDWCIVLLEIPLTRFEECWPLLTESLPELP